MCTPPCPCAPPAAPACGRRLGKAGSVACPASGRCPVAWVCAENGGGSVKKRLVQAFVRGSAYGLPDFRGQRRQVVKAPGPLDRQVQAKTAQPQTRRQLGGDR